MKKLIHIALLFILSLTGAYAQLSFPQGPVLNLNTHTDFLYHETGIYFYTGQNKVTDYDWVFHSDSLDPRWDFQACMNGDCKVGLPLQGPFITAFGINDTTGYIKFHVNTFGKDGRSVVRYEVEHQSDTSDHALLVFNISYTNNTSVTEGINISGIKIYPNPASTFLHVDLPQTADCEVSIIKPDGTKVMNSMIKSGDERQVEINSLNDGMYFVELRSGNLVSHKCIQIIHNN